MIQSNFSDAVKVVGVNTTAFAISLTQIESVLRFASVVAALLYTSLKIWDWWEERRGKKQSKRDGMLEIILICFLVSGCAAPKISRHAVDGTRQVQAATVHVAKAQAASTRAQESIATGKGAVTELKRTATPEQKPHVDRLEQSLATTGREAEIMRISLDEIAPRLTAAQASIDVLGSKLLNAERDAQGYRRLKLWLALFVGAGAAYVAFRMVPAVSGPFRFYASGASGVIAATLTYFIL